MNLITIQDTRINMDNVLYYGPTVEYLTATNDKLYNIKIYFQEKNLVFTFENEKIRDEYLSQMDNAFFKLPSLL